ncbi:MAG: GGDEF domain-containing protein [Atopobiaceae bacterium]|nr:GGDEF domain-containing protein [Atopobiaceae bacterium]
MQREYSREDIEYVMKFLSTGKNVVRLVDPMSELVLDSNGIPIQGALCNNVWGHGHRCENCSSLRALQTEETIYKMEFNRDRVYWITSRFVIVEGHPCILEVVADTTDYFIIESTQLEEVGKVIEGYNHQLITDALTGALNRNYLDKVFIPSLEFRQTHNIPVHIALIDLDEFKSINDTYGHNAGDVVLSDVGGFWKRKFDSRSKNEERVIVRYGGDEFIAIDCKNTFEDFQKNVEGWYERMRKTSYLGEGSFIPFSMSIGFASTTETGDWNWDNLFKRADERMYAQKQAHHALISSET